MSMQAEAQRELKSAAGKFLDQLKSEMGTWRDELIGDLHGTVSSLTRHMYAAMMGQMVALLSLAYFFVTRLAG